MCAPSHYAFPTSVNRFGLYLGFESTTMDKYRITQHDSGFIVTLNAGPTIDVCKTQDEAKQIIGIREHDYVILETARRLVKEAVNELMRTHHIDRRTAQDWIKETVG